MGEDDIQWQIWARNLDMLEMHGPGQSWLHYCYVMLCCSACHTKHEECLMMTRLSLRVVSREELN